MNLRSFFRKTIITFMMIAIVAGLIGPQPTKAADEPKVDVSLSYGYGGTLLLGYHAPFTVEVTNRSQDFEGSVWLIIGEGRNDVIGYEKKLTLPSGSSKTVSFVPNVTGFYQDCKIRITDSKNKTVYENNFDLQIEDTSTYARIGVLSDDYSVFSQMSGQPVEYLPTVSLLPIKLTEKNISEDYHALESLNAIIISDYSTDRLTSGQRKAILDWVASSRGLLILGTGTGASKVLKGFPELPEIKTGALKAVSTRFGYADDCKTHKFSFTYSPNRSYGYEFDAAVIYNSIDPSVFESEEFLSIPNDNDRYEYLYENYEKEFIDGAWINYFGEAYDYMKASSSPYDFQTNLTYFKDYCVNNICDELIKLHSRSKKAARTAEDDVPYYTAQILELYPDNYPVIYGEIENSTELYPFVDELSYGLGDICIIATDVSKTPFSDSQYFNQTFSYLLSLYRASDLFEGSNYVRYGIRMHSPDSYAYKNTADHLSFGNLLPLPAYFLIFVSYTILGFVAFFFLRKRNRSIWLWPIQGALAIAATILILVCSLATRINHPVVNTVKFSEITDNVVEETSLSAVVLPKNKKYIIDFSKEHVPQLLRDNSYYYYRNNNEPTNDYNVAWLDEEGRNSVALYGHAALSSETLAFSRTKSTEGYEIEFVNEYSDYKLSGYVKNNTEKTLEDCVVYLDYLVYPIGTLTPGQRVDLSTIEPKSVFRQYSTHVSQTAVSRMLANSGEQGSDNFAAYFMGFMNKQFKKDYLKNMAAEHLLSLSDGTGAILHSEYSVPYSYGYSNPLTLEEFFAYLGLNEDGHPAELTSTPYFIGYDMETAGTMLAQGCDASENTIEVILIPGNMN